ncbi:hypothetical protein CYMTET_51573 [Cymbomonas tetramitiformis]|uniref:Uncharacterized protein n=1 Tax=Cymbomonas tetramitiformis TaxID=36881 RepID=A0AAE0BM92_9CHLO|nr:hypothetical protein CYMTET_51573 [Cymbomonas tetramitiformis]
MMVGMQQVAPEEEMVPSLVEGTPVNTRASWAVWPPPVKEVAVLEEQMDETNMLAEQQAKLIRESAQYQKAREQQRQLTQQQQLHMMHDPGYDDLMAVKQHLDQNFPDDMDKVSIASEARTDLTSSSIVPAGRTRPVPPPSAGGALEPHSRKPPPPPPEEERPQSPIDLKMEGVEK